MKLYLFNLQLNKKYRHPKLVRERSFQCEDYITFNSPENIYRLATEILHLHIKAEEYTYALCFDTALQSLQGVFEISHGSIVCSILSPREVLLRALFCIIIPLVIQNQIKRIYRMQKACELIGIPLIDHHY